MIWNFFGRLLRKKTKTKLMQRLFVYELAGTTDCGTDAWWHHPNTFSPQSCDTAQAVHLLVSIGGKTIRFQSLIVLPAVMGLEPTEFTLVRQRKTLLGLRPFAFLLLFCCYWYIGAIKLWRVEGISLVKKKKKKLNTGPSTRRSAWQTRRYLSRVGALLSFFIFCTCWHE